MLYQFCLARGLRPAQLAADWGVAEDALADVEAWVPYELGLALWDALIATSGGDPVGIEFGLRVGFVDLGVVGVAAAHAATVADAFLTFEPLRHLVDPGLELQLLNEPRGRVLVCASHPSLRRRVHPMEAMLVSTNTGLCRLTQELVRPLRVEFAATPCAAAEIYREHFGLEPEVTDRYALTYSPEVWALPLAGAHPLVLKYLVEHGHNQPAPPRAPSSFAARVDEWLRAQVHNSERPLMACQLADAAHELRTSRRDLQRRLTGEGTSFRKLQEQIARERARELLQQPGASSAEVASALGYAEARSFQRACYRWFKAGPGALRAKA